MNEIQIGVCKEIERLFNRKFLTSRLTDWQANSGNFVSQLAAGQKKSLSEKQVNWLRKIAEVVGADEKIMEVF